MAFKLLYTNLAGPQGDFLVDSAVSFEAGMLGKLQGTTAGLPQVTLAGAAAAGTIVGIIDDNKTSQFVATVVNEAVASGATTLNHANVVSGTLVLTGFATGNPAASFNYTNGAFNAATSATGTASYSYYIPGKAGDDTTLASGKCTLWLQPGEYSTDVYEVASTTLGTGNAVSYTVGSKLYSSTNSKLTTEASVATTVVASGAGGVVVVTGVNANGSTLVGYVTKAPSAGNPFLNFYKV